MCVPFREGGMKEREREWKKERVRREDGHQNLILRNINIRISVVRESEVSIQESISGKQEWGLRKCMRQKIGIPCAPLMVVWSFYFMVLWNWFVLLFFIKFIHLASIFGGRQSAQMCIRKICFCFENLEPWGKYIGRR